MKTSGVTLLHDGSMLAAVCLLEVWPSTGVPLHEVLALALATAAVVHVTMQSTWIAAQGRRFFGHSTLRSRVNVLLNSLLFVSMTVAVASGVAISKFVVPRAGRTPSDYLNWHHLHDLSANVLFFVVGLHLALNWSLVRTAFRRVSSRTALANAAAAAEPAPARAVGGVRRALLVAAIVIGVGVGVSGALVAVKQALPADEAFSQHDGGRVDHDGGPVAHEERPPPDMAALRPNQLAPQSRAVVPVGLRFVVILATAFVGRTVLRVRL